MTWQTIIVIYFVNRNFINPVALARPLYTTQNQSEERNYSQQVVKKPISQSVIFNDAKKCNRGRTENYPFLQQNKNNSNNEQFEQKNYTTQRRRLFSSKPTTALYE